MPTNSYPDTGVQRTVTITQTVTGPGGVDTDQKSVTIKPGVYDTPQIRGIANGSSNTGGTFSVNVPAGVVQGDLLILAIAQRATQPTFTVASVWDLQGVATFDATRQQYIEVYSRVAGPNIGSTISVTSDSANAAIGYCIVVQLGSFSTNFPLNFLPEGWFTNSATSTSVPTETTTSDKTVRFALATQLWGTTNPTLSVTGTWNDDGQKSTTASGNNLAAVLQHRTSATAGNTTSATITSSQANVWAGTHFVVNPPNGNAPYVKPSGTARFAGDPGKGKWYIGGSPDPYLGLSRRDSLQFWEDQVSAQTYGTTAAKTRKLGVYRTYSFGQPNWNEIDWALNRRIIPCDSCFPSGDTSAASTWDAYTNGNQNALLDTIYSQFKKRHPETPIAFNGSVAIPKGYIWYTLGGHEPEDNITTVTAKASYRAMKRYCYKYFVNKFAADGLTPNIAHVDTYYMSGWTIQGYNQSKRDWRTWFIDWKGTTKGTLAAPSIDDFYTGTQSCTEMIGLDHYQGPAWWLGDAISAYNVNWFRDTMQTVDNMLGLLNKPYCIGESGFRNPQTGHFTGTDAAGVNDGWVPDAGSFRDDLMLTFMDNMINQIDTFDVVGYNYWNSVKAPSGTPTGVEGENRFEALKNGSYDPHQSRYKGWAKWTDDPRTVRFT